MRRKSFILFTIAGLLCSDAPEGAAQEQTHQRARATIVGFPVSTGQSFRDCSDCPEMVVIPPGSFLMGSDREEMIREQVPDNAANLERPQHTVRVLAPLAVGKFHVTRGEYANFIQETGHSTADSCLIFEFTMGYRARTWRDLGFPQTERDPVVCVFWDDAKAYAAWLSSKTGHNYRLLTEAEWEYAARGGTSTARWWGNSNGPYWSELNDVCQHINAGDQSARPLNIFSVGCRDGFTYTAPAGSFDANPFGLYDMLGNAWQWVEDCWRPAYDGAPENAAIAVSEGDCQNRVLRGGSWKSGSWTLRAAARGYGLAADRGYGFEGPYADIGFRIAREADE